MIKACLSEQKIYFDTQRIKRLINKNRTTVTKAKVFTVSQLNKYLDEAPNTGHFLVDKLVLLFGLYGNMRCNELTYLTVEDIAVKTDTNGKLFLNVTIRKSKTDQEGNGFNFHVKPLYTDYCPIKLFLNYRPFVEKGRLWRTYNNKIRKFTTRPLGINMIRQVPKRIADFLDLKGNYTGHSIRRTSSTTFAESENTTIMDLKRFGRWKSTTVALGYLDKSEKVKDNLASKIKSRLNQKPPPKKSKPRSTTTFNNCTFNFSNVQNVSLTNKSQ